jgi:hypothetical protein
MQCGGPKGVRRPAGGHQGAGRQAFGGRYTAGKRRQRENGNRGKRGTGKNIHKKITKKHWHKAIRVAAAAVYRRQRRAAGDRGVGLQGPSGVGKNGFSFLLTEEGLDVAV